MIWVGPISWFEMTGHLWPFFITFVAHIVLQPQPLLQSFDTIKVQFEVRGLLGNWHLPLICFFQYFLILSHFLIKIVESAVTALASYIFSLSARWIISWTFDELHLIVRTLWWIKIATPLFPEARRMLTRWPGFWGLVWRAPSVIHSPLLGCRGHLIWLRSVTPGCLVMGLPAFRLMVAASRSIPFTWSTWVTPSFSGNSVLDTHPFSWFLLFVLTKTATDRSWRCGRVGLWGVNDWLLLEFGVSERIIQLLSGFWIN